LGWLGRRRRMETPTEKHRLCMDRRVVKWLGRFDRPRPGGLFATKRNPLAMTAVAEYFFFRCRLAANRPMGRPRYTADQIAKKLKVETDLADSTFYRLKNSRLSEGKTPDLLGIKLPTL